MNLFSNFLVLTRYQEMMIEMYSGAAIHLISISYGLLNQYDWNFGSGSPTNLIIDKLPNSSELRMIYCLSCARSLLDHHDYA